MSDPRIENAIADVQSRFPFTGYMDSNGDANRNIASTVVRHLASGSRILDFGSGPCDKTAIIQAIGYRCSALDELGDDWHLIDQNREKIAEFAQNSGIDFKFASDDGLKFEPQSFDIERSE